MNYKIYGYLVTIDSEKFLVRYSKSFVPIPNFPDYAIVGSEFASYADNTVFEVECSEFFDNIKIIKDYNKNTFLYAQIESANKENNQIYLTNKKSISFKNIPIPANIYIEQTKWDLITATIFMKKYPLFLGPKGCGKTELAYALAKVMEYNFYPINCGTLFKPKQTLVGQLHAKDGNTFLVNSEFLTHYQSDQPTVIFLDELSRIPTMAANYMMLILDRKESYIYVEELGKRVYKGKNVVFIAAANFGIEYVDTRQQDGAFMDRFIKFHLDYLEQDQEVDLVLNKVDGVDKNTIQELVKLVNIFRDSSKTFGQSISTRQVIDMSEYISYGFDIDTIVNNVLVNLYINGQDDRRKEIETFLASIR